MSTEQWTTVASVLSASASEEAGRLGSDITRLAGEIDALQASELPEEICAPIIRRLQAQKARYEQRKTIQDAKIAHAATRRVDGMNRGELAVVAQLEAYSAGIAKDLLESSVDIVEYGAALSSAVALLPKSVSQSVLDQVAAQILVRMQR